MTEIAATPKVLVLGKEDRAFLAVVRSLGRRGMQVHLAWCPPDALARRSRYVVKVHEIPPYSPADDAWKQAFIAACREEQFDLVVPTNDSTIIPLQAHRAELEAYARFYLLDPETCDVAFDKERTYDLARTAGIALPRQLHVTLPADPAAILAELALPVVLKPRASFRLEDVRTKSFVRKVFAPEQLGRQLQTFAPQGEVWVQEYWPGVGVGVEGLVDRGEVLLAFQHVRIHERRMGGADSYRKSVPLQPDLLEAFVRMMEALRYTGVAMMEFRVNPDTGKWVFLELNARFWASLPLAIAAGADFPYYLYQLLTEGRREFPQYYRAGIYCRNWGRDLTWLKENFQAPVAERVPVRHLLREIGPILLLREHSDTFVVDDPLPGLVDVGRVAGRVIAKSVQTGRSALSRIPSAFARIPPLRRLRAARARAALRRAETVLFVCKGNICRSPFAEAYARARLASGVRVMSAGYYPKIGRPCPEDALTAAQELGVDLAAHRSTVLSDELIRAAQVIFVFDRENERTVVGRYPSARGKVHRLGHLLGNGVIDIRDPYGGSLEEFRATYRKIGGTLDRYAPARK